MTAPFNPIALIVDDDDLSTELLMYVLQSQGYQVHNVVTVDAAIAFIQRSYPNLILLDYVLPDRFGTDVIDYLEATGRIHSTHVVLSTAYPRSHFSERHMKHVSFLPKPARLKDLRTLINGKAVAQYAS